MSSVGLDVGGTYLKAARLADDGTVGPVTRRPVPAFLDTAGSAREIDPAVLVTAAAELVDGLLTDGPADDVLVTGQMAGIAFVDDDGQPAAPLISWQDTRATHVERVASVLGPQAVADLGDGLRVGLPLVTLAELGVPAGARVTSLLAFVAGALAGTLADTVHVTDAAAWGLYDLRGEQWSPLALNLVGVSAADLPAVTWNLAPVGSRSGVPVLCAVGDQQASLAGAGLGQGAFADHVSVNLATGCQVSVVADEFDSLGQTRPFFAAEGARRYLHTVTHLPAGRLLTAAVLEARGSAEGVDWAWAAEVVDEDPRIGAAVEVIVTGIVGAVDRLGARRRPVLFSGGLVQQFAPIRQRVLDALAVPGSVFSGDDAALAGLARLTRGFGS